MDKINGIIYKCTCLTSGKIYVGQTKVTLEKRISQHMRSKSYFDRALRKYGCDNFEWKIIDHANTHEDLNEKEIFWIKFYGSLKPAGYNLTSGGLNFAVHEETKKKISMSLVGKYTGENSSGFGRICSEATREKLSIAHKGKIISEKQKKQISAAHKGKIVSKETRQKISAAGIGRVHTEEQNRKMSIMMSGENSPNFRKIVSKEVRLKQSLARKGKYGGKNHPMFGKHHSEESLKKMSESRMGKYAGENHPNFGKTANDELRQKLSDSHKGKHPSEETKLKMAMSQKLRREKEHQTIIAMA